MSFKETYMPEDTWENYRGRFTKPQCRTIARLRAFSKRRLKSVAYFSPADLDKAMDDLGGIDGLINAWTGQNGDTRISLWQVYMDFERLSQRPASSQETRKSTCRIFNDALQRMSAQERGDFMLYKEYVYPAMWIALALRKSGFGRDGKYSKYNFLIWFRNGCTSGLSDLREAENVFDGYERIDQEALLNEFANLGIMPQTPE